MREAGNTRVSRLQAACGTFTLTVVSCKPAQGKHGRAKKTSKNDNKLMEGKMIWPEGKRR